MRWFFFLALILAGCQRQPPPLGKSAAPSPPKHEMAQPSIAPQPFAPQEQGNIRVSVVSVSVLPDGKLLKKDLNKASPNMPGSGPLIRVEYRVTWLGKAAIKKGRSGTILFNGKMLEMAPKMVPDGYVIYNPGGKNTTQIVYYRRGLLPKGTTVKLTIPCGFNDEEHAFVFANVPVEE